MYDRDRQAAWLAGIVGTLAGGASATTAVRNADAVQKAFEDRFVAENPPEPVREPFNKGQQDPD